jgi:hypothetical protein
VQGQPHLDTHGAATGSRHRGGIVHRTAQSVEGGPAPAGIYCAGTGSTATAAREAAGTPHTEASDTPPAGAEGEKATGHAGPARTGGEAAGHLSSDIRRTLPMPRGGGVNVAGGDTTGGAVQTGGGTAVVGLYPTIES